MIGQFILKARQIGATRETKVGPNQEYMYLESGHMYVSTGNMTCNEWEVLLSSSSKAIKSYLHHCKV